MDIADKMAIEEESFRPKKDEKKRAKRFSDLISNKPVQIAARPGAPPEDVKKNQFHITKFDDDKMLAFGWANVSIRTGGDVIVDWQEDIIEPDELENAAYQFVELYREGGEMHERGNVAVLIESIVFTEEKQKALGLEPGVLPIGWWIGFKVTDPDVWEKVKDGTYSMFSIEGEAERVEVEE